MSHLQGTDYVGSMVVLEDGIPNPSAYRRFKIKDVHGNDDYAAMEEVLTRRLKSFLKEEDTPVEERSSKFAYPPQLLLVDGGRGQLGVAVRVVEELGLKGLSEGDAQVSELHANYIVNKGKANPNEIFQLIEKVRKKVLQKKGIKLLNEVKIVNEK